MKEPQTERVAFAGADRISPGLQIRSPARCSAFSNRCLRRSKQHELPDRVEQEIPPSTRSCVKARKPVKRLNSKQNEEGAMNYHKVTLEEAEKEPQPKELVVKKSSANRRQKKSSANSEQEMISPNRRQRRDSAPGPTETRLHPQPKEGEKRVSVG